jgi:hypothetical protein
MGGCAYSAPYKGDLLPTHPASVDAVAAKEPPVSSTLAFGDSEKENAASGLSDDDKTSAQEGQGSKGMMHGSHHHAH